LPISIKIPSVILWLKYIDGRVGHTNYSFISSNLWQECLISTNVYKILVVILS